MRLEKYLLQNYQSAILFITFVVIQLGKSWMPSIQKLTTHNMNLQKTAAVFIIILSTIFLLIYGQSILVPFILGMLLWFIGREIKNALDKIPFVKRNLPNWSKHILSLVLIITVLSFVSNIITSNINYLVQSLDKYQPNVDAIIGQLDDLLKIDVAAKLKDYSGNLQFGSILRSLFASFTDIISNAFMILLYAVFVLLEEDNFRPKLQAIFVEKDQSERVDMLLEKIGGSVSNYLRLKTLVSLVTGILSYIALWMIGVDAPEFWAFLIFILNFIPTIGSLVGTVFPAIFCLFQFGEFLPSILVLSIVGLIQLLVGNFLEPKLMGSSMNISPLVTILSLSIWGAIWGITGMILSVPITVIMIIILSQFERTKPVAIMLSEKGNITTG